MAITISRNNVTAKRRLPWMRSFLASLSECPNVSFAAKQAKIPRQNAYLERSSNPEFAKDWDDALNEGLDMIESNGMLRARKQSDVLTIFFLKHHRPHIYNPEVMMAKDAAALGQDIAALACEFISGTKQREFRERLAIIIKNSRGKRA